MSRLRPLVPSPNGNHHNPALSPDTLKRLREMQWQSRMTWAQFYEWAVPILEKAMVDERKRSPSA